MARVLLLGGLAESLVNFRGPLLRALVDRGHQVLAAAPGPAPAVAADLAAMGVDFRAVPLERAGLNPLRDLATLGALTRLCREVQPEVALGYTIKPVVWGSLAARRAGVRRVYSLVTGLGWTFLGAGMKARLAGLIARGLYRVALRRNDLVFFQNPDDERLFRDQRLLAPGARTLVVPGSGVDLDRFETTPLPEGPPRFLLIARMLRDKGIAEFVAAARRLRASYPHVRFRLVGPLDLNPASFRREEIEGWVAEGVVEWTGELADVRPELARATVYVLPSYREGMPRTVLEAMATGRAIVTTDVPGCRETVREGANGFLVPPRDVPALSAAMERFLLEPGLAARMGMQSRQLAVERFDVRRVNGAMLAAMGL